MCDVVVCGISFCPILLALAGPARLGGSDPKGAMGCTHVHEGAGGETDQGPMGEDLRSTFLAHLTTLLPHQSARHPTLAHILADEGAGPVPSGCQHS